MSLPMNSIDPSVGSSSRTMQRASVDLPQPDSPTMPTRLAGAHLERHAVDRLDATDLLLEDDPAADREMLDDVRQAQDRLAAGRRLIGRHPIVDSSLLFTSRVAWSRWHAARCAAVPIGASARRRLVAAALHTYAQRAWNRHRAAGAAGSAACPGIDSRRSLSRSRPGSDSSRPHGVGMLRPLEDLGREPCSTIRPAYITIDVVAELGDDAEIVRDQDHGGAELGSQARDQLEDLRLDGDVERRRRLVGDQQLRVVDQRHRDHHALAHAAGQLVRIARASRSGVAGCRPPSASRRRGARPRRRRDVACAARSASIDLPADRCRPGSATSSGPGRSSRSRAPRIAAQLVRPSSGGRGRRAGPRRRPCAAPGEQAHHVRSVTRLPAARLADDAEHPAAPRPRTTRGRPRRPGRHRSGTSSTGPSPRAAASSSPAYVSRIRGSTTA